MMKPLPPTLNFNGFPDEREFSKILPGVPVADESWIFPAHFHEKRSVC